MFSVGHNCGKDEEAVDSSVVRQKLWKFAVMLPKAEKMLSDSQLVLYYKWILNVTNSF